MGIEDQAHSQRRTQMYYSITTVGIEGRAVRTRSNDAWSIYFNNRLVAQLFGTVHEMKREIKDIIKSDLNILSPVAIRKTVHR